MSAQMRNRGGNSTATAPLISSTATEKPKPASRKKLAAPFKVTDSFPRCTYFNPIAWFVLVLDIFLILVTFKWLGYFRAMSPRVVNKGKAKRHHGSETSLIDNCFNCRTAWEFASRAFQKYANKQGMGTRKFLGMHKSPKARFPLKKFGSTSWMKYKEVGERVRAFGCGLIELGLIPLPKDEGTKIEFENTTQSHAILVYEETSADWMIALMGAWSQALVVATSYATLGMSSVADAANECNVKAIVCNFKDVEKVGKAIAKMSGVTHIIYTTNYVTAADSATPPKAEGVTVMSFDQVVALGRKVPHPPTPPTPDNMAVVMYTSGSTGKPKGVMLRQKNVIASVGMLLNYVQETGLIREGKETYLAYLPAAHIMELCVEFSIFGYGGRVGYSHPRSFSSAGAVRLDEATGKLHEGAVMKYPTDETQNFAPGGLQCFRPTFMIAVPKIWDILKKGVEAKLGKKGAVVRSLVHFGYAWRNWLLKHNMDSVIITALFKKLFHPILGGRQLIFATGGGPISSEVQSFVRTIFCCPLVQGYALTETCCAGTIQYPSDSRDGVVGPPVGAAEIMLRDVMEDEVDSKGQPTGRKVGSVLDRNGKPYLSSDTSHYGFPCDGRGEVLIRGPSVSAGYLKLPKKTKKEFDSQGWFHTGDIALFTLDGCIKIVDRLKNLVKLKGGEYIAIESMEKEYSKSVYVNGINGGLMCYGDGDMDRPVALVQANMDLLRKWAAANGINAGTDDELCANPVINKMVLKDLVTAGKQGGVSSNEVLTAVHLISGNGSELKQELNSPWKPENGFLTASNKLQRKTILNGLKKITDVLKKKGIK